MSRSRELAELATAYDSGGSFAFRNRIINGQMMIDQRNAGASVTATVTGTQTYTIDRWGYQVTQASKMTVQRNAGAVTPPAGFTNYLGVTSSSAYSVVSSDYFAVSQRLEGFNTADLGWGAAGAQSITLSFWVRSSLTGTFGGSLMNAGYTRSYPFTYTVSAANTWEQKTITIAGDTTGTWATDNGTGIQLWFGLGMGSAQSGPAGAWAGSAYLSATGATSVVGTSGATFYITGVQLEKGSTATSFDYRPYGTELALCQRYYQQFSGNTNVGVGMGVSTATSSAAITVKNTQTLRAAPTIGYSNIAITDFRTYTTAVTSITSTTYYGVDSSRIDFNTAGVQTAAQAVGLIINGGSLTFSSEL